MKKIFFNLKIKFDKFRKSQMLRLENDKRDKLI